IRNGGQKMFKRIDHTELVTDKPDETVAFYTETLGFKVRARDRIPQSGTGGPLDLVYLELGGTTVELLSYPGAKVGAAPSGIHLGYNLIALEVEDMQKALAFLKTKGVAPVGADRARDLCPRRNCRPERLSHRIAAVVLNGGVLIVAGGLIVTFWDGTR